jgi:hypothetical protein
MPSKRKAEEVVGPKCKVAGPKCEVVRVLRSVAGAVPDHPAGVTYYGGFTWTEFGRNRVHYVNRVHRSSETFECEHPRGVDVYRDLCAVAAANGLVIYDLRRRQVERTFPQIRGALDVAFTPDGRGVYVTGNNALTLVNLADGKCTTAGGKLLETRGVAVSADGRFAFVSLGLGNYRQLQVVRVDLKNGKVSWPFKKCRGIGPVTGISILGNYLYVVGPDCREVCRVDLRVPGERVTVYEASHGFYGVAVSPDGACVVVTKWGADGRVIEFDVTPEPGQQPGHQPGHEASEDAGSSAAPAPGSSAAPASGSSAAPASGPVPVPVAALGAGPVAGAVAGPVAGPVAVAGAGHDAVAARQAKLLTMQFNAATTAFWHAVELEQLASDSYGVGSPLHTEAKEQMQLAEAWVKELLPKFPRPWTRSVDGDCP